MRTKFNISRFESINHRYPTREVLSWEQVVREINNPIIHESKRSLPLWSGASFRRERRRGDTAKSVEAVHLLFLDVDDGLDFDRTVAILAKHNLKGIVHTTHSHTASHHRMRIIIPTLEPIPPDHYPFIWNHLNYVFEGNLDKATKDVGRLSFVPAMQGPGSQYWIHLQDGQPFDWTSVPKPRKPKKRIIESPSASIGLKPCHAYMRSKYLDAALKNNCREIAETPPGRRNRRLNNSAYQLGRVADEIGFGLNDVCLDLVAAAVETGLTQKEALATVKSAFKAGQAKPRVPKTPPFRRKPPQPKNVDDPRIFALMSYLKALKVSKISRDLLLTLFLLSGTKRRIKICHPEFTAALSERLGNPLSERFTTDALTRILRWQHARCLDLVERNEGWLILNFKGTIRGILSRARKSKLWSKSQAEAINRQAILFAAKSHQDFSEDILENLAIFENPACIDEDRTVQLQSDADLNEMETRNDMSTQQTAKEEFDSGTMPEYETPKPPPIVVCSGDSRVGYASDTKVSMTTNSGDSNRYRQFHDATEKLRSGSFSSERTFQSVSDATFFVDVVADGEAVNKDGRMATMERKRIDEINERLSRITNGQWERGKTGGTVISANSTRPSMYPEEVSDYGGALIGKSIINRDDVEFIAAAPDDIRFLLDLVARLSERAEACNVDTEVAELTGSVRLLEVDVDNLKAAVDELRRTTRSAPFSPEIKRLGGHPPVSFEPAPWEK